jgi:hypothetical protein
MNIKVDKNIQDLRPFFWDTEFEKIDIEKNRDYVIERILEVGDSAAVKWLFATYPPADIKRALAQSRTLSKKSRNFWDLILNAPGNV